MHRSEDHGRPPVPLGGKAERVARLYDAVHVQMGVEQAPRIDFMWGRLNIQNQDFRMPFFPLMQRRVVWKHGDALAL